MTDLSLDTALCLYRVAQEALRNVVKHAGVDEADVSLTAECGEVTLVVQDLGHARKARSNEPSGLGLVSMRERVKRQGGVFCSEKRPEGGSRLVASVPLSTSASVCAKPANAAHS